MRAPKKTTEKRTVEAHYIFRAQSPSTNQYTKVAILPLSHLKAGWVDLKAPAPSLSTTTATMMAPASKTMVSILTISTEMTAKDTTAATAPTAKTITT